MIDAVEAGAQHHRQREVRIARRIRHAQLDARRGAARGGHAHQRAAILLGPRDRGRRLVAGHQALVRIHERVGDRAEALRVLQQSADVVQARLAQLNLVLRIEERVLAALEERLMRVHARAVHAEDRLRHEGRVQVVVQRHVLDDEAARAHVVRRRQHIVIVKIDLVLARRDFVMRGLDVHAHLLEGDDDLAADVFAEIDRREVEVAGAIVRFGGRLAVAAQEQEELGFRARPSS